MSPKDKKYTGRFLLILFGSLIIWALLVGKLYMIQVVNGDEYRKIGKRQTENKEPIPAIRGHIYDRDQQQLTMNVPQYSFGAHPDQIQDRYTVASRFAGTFHRPRNHYLNRMNTSRPFVWLERNVDKARAKPILDIQDPGIIEKTETERYYPYRELAAQVIGMTGVDGQGLNGIEAQYDSLLRGQDGWTILRKNGRGSSMPSPRFPSIDPVNGHDIELTLDLEYQSIVEEALSRGIDRYSAASGMAILLDPRTGAILSMTSLPSYDPNDPPRSQPGFRKNRTITDVFEPGSTIKVATLTAALEENIIDLQDLFYCEQGQISVEGEVIRDWDPFGWLTFKDVIVNSSNVGTIKAADEIGSAVLYRYLRKYGFGTPTGINLLGEVSGVVHPLQNWREISRASVSIGHEITVTALQMVMAYGAIANDGYLMKPYLIKRIYNEQGKTVFHRKPAIIRQVASTQTMRQVRRVLRDVVQKGTGHKAQIEGVHIAGKTGTAQKVIDGTYSQRKFISSFIGFLPAERPRLLCAVFLDSPEYGNHWGGYAAAPIVRDIFSQIINSTDDQFYMATDEREAKAAAHLSRESTSSPFVSLLSQSVIPRAEEAVSAPTKYPARMPDVRGLSLRKALVKLYALDLEVDIDGYGRVVQQTPTPGARVSRGATCRLKLSS